jgi:hypothetical protein
MFRVWGELLPCRVVRSCQSALIGALTGMLTIVALRPNADPARSRMTPSSS